MLRTYNKGIVDAKIFPVTDVWASLGSLLHSKNNKNIYIYGEGLAYVAYNEGGGAPIRFVDWTSDYYSTTLISAIRITDGGNILVFGTGKELHYSLDNGTTYHASTILKKDGTPFVFHTPVNAEYYGSYFDNYLDLYAESNGVIVIGNYANVFLGASPVLLFYSIDGGVTFKVFYEFGQNPAYTDDGTANGGEGGVLLGDPSNPVIARHIHGINVDARGNFWCCTGESGSELHFFKMSYSNISDSWNIIDYLNEESRGCQRMRAINLYEHDGYIYWGSDGVSLSLFRGEYLQSLGIWRAKISDINDLSKHELLYDSPTTHYSFLKSDNYVVAGFVSGDNTNKILFSTNNGKGWKLYSKSDDVDVWKSYYDKYNNRFIYGWRGIISYDF